MTVSATWFDHPVAVRPGNAADTAPDPASLTTATSRKPPAEPELTYTVAPEATAPVGDVSANDTVGAVLSTRTLGTSTELCAFPTLSTVTARRSYRPSATTVVSQLTA